MPKKSVRENKTIYQLAREQAGLTRALASEKTGFLSESVIEKIEYGEKSPDADEVLALARAYRRMDLTNQYCTAVCPIGMRYKPAVNMSSLSDIVLNMLDSLNHLEKEKNRLIEITADGKISPEEMEDFARIQKLIGRISNVADSMRLWVEQSDAEGTVNREALEKLMENGKR